jgi:hypothetical protein
VAAIESFDELTTQATPTPPCQAEGCHVQQQQVRHLLGRLPRQDRRLHRGVALQVAFERQTLKPVFSLDRL